MRAGRHTGRLFLTTFSSVLLLAGWALAAHSDHGCDACHTPHNAGDLPGVPLWNGNETITNFTMYSSATFQASIDGQPSGSSRLCLSCHDGANPKYLWMSGDVTFGADELVNTHPISFVYDSSLAVTDGGLKDPSLPSTLGRTIAQDLLDPASKMQCTSCHDVHSSGVGEFLLRGYDYGYETVTNPDGSTSTVHHGPELCRMCHLK
jgi:hypothetical protein